VTPEPRIRPATAADIPGIRAVLAETWRDTYGAFVPLAAIEQATAVWHAPQVLAAELARATTFTGVAEDAGGLLGMVTAHARPTAVEIARLYVLPAAQRRGLGGRLLDAALAALPDRGTVRLEVEAQNPKGRAFYVKEGFVATGERTIEAFGVELRVVVMERGRALGAAPGHPGAP
jgi:ribosomal protein S18 acetylase RimI-like enzyme